MPTDRRNSLATHGRTIHWVSYGAKEPYHYRSSDVEFCCRALPWKAVNLGDWAHPLSLQMIEFEKTS